MSFQNLIKGRNNHIPKEFVQEKKDIMKTLKLNYIIDSCLAVSQLHAIDRYTKLDLALGL